MCNLLIGVKTCEDVGEEQADPEVVTVHGSQESGTEVEKTKRVSLEKHESLVQKQQSDPSLQHALRSTVSMQEAKDVPKCYSLHDAILFRKLKRIKLLLNKLFIARRFLHLDHESLVSTKKTSETCSRHLYWPSMQKDVKLFCCHTCQVCQR